MWVLIWKLTTAESIQTGLHWKPHRLRAQIPLATQGFQLSSFFVDSIPKSTSSAPQLIPHGLIRTRGGCTLANWQNWKLGHKRGERGHNLELTVRLVLCEHKIVNDSGPAWNFWFHFIELGDISYNCVWWVGGKFSIERIHPEKRNFPCNVFYSKMKEISLLERKKDLH